MYRTSFYKRYCHLVPGHLYLPRTERGRGVPDPGLVSEEECAAPGPVTAPVPLIIIIIIIIIFIIIVIIIT